MITEEQLVSARAVFAQSKVCVTSNRVLLAQTRYLIARSRRRLNPVFEVSGGVGPTAARDGARTTRERDIASLQW
jgi:hypothetical protein